MEQLLFWKERLKSLWKKEGRLFLGAGLLAVVFTVVFAGYVAKGYAEEIISGISGKVVRFHVLANSDSAADQALKLAVRDRVLAEFGERLEDCTSKTETLDLLERSREEICRIAAGEVAAQGYTYPVRVWLVREDFPEKQYGQLVFPAGVYDSLRIEIGQGAGHNWWCVLYPQMCYVDAAFSEPTEEGHDRLCRTLAQEEYTVVSAMESDKTMPKFKLKIVELWQNR
ncbi:stage II sporulation protein R [Anaerotignum lactatifermentans]|uniref:Stage II sporulation protein R n=1 Tax=Anaerotignum lactatifermentans TaxID=160404 RepID=A0ABS2G771_9FIRM|nr:stage II sporulation protein R [Anaerotignum lactatifermentans]MBM6829067.1 stage II sporulation protein R [Anaerotignum lactatifermentans]MBM6877326.1 stage II sporulation protein R [Anaerotignum lactatifermentans]MBM6950697.1 stage II sporulation protein R [Anaerotignum lactatifermentans]